MFLWHYNDAIWPHGTRRVALAATDSWPVKHKFLIMRTSARQCTQPDMPLHDASDFSLIICCMHCSMLWTQIYAYQSRQLAACSELSLLNAFASSCVMMGVHLQWHNYSSGIASNWWPSKLLATKDVDVKVVH